jgi:hypothetical protein
MLALWLEHPESHAGNSYRGTRTFARDRDELPMAMWGPPMGHCPAMQAGRESGWILATIGCLGLVFAVTATVLLVRQGLPGIVTAGPPVSAVPSTGVDHAAGSNGTGSATPASASPASGGLAGQAAELHPLASSVTPGAGPGVPPTANPAASSVPAMSPAATPTGMESVYAGPRR